MVDDDYQDHVLFLREQEAEELKGEIKKGVDDLDVYDLRLINHIRKNITDYRAFFKVLKQHNP